MWKCPKCGTENEAGWICKKCRHDDSKNYERHLLPFPLPAQTVSKNPSLQKSDVKKEKKKDRKRTAFVMVCSVLLILVAMFSLVMGVLLLQESDLPGKVFGLCWLAAGILSGFIVWLLMKWRIRKKKVVETEQSEMEKGSTSFSSQKDEA
ncbi:MAG: hypothetical protein ACLU6W_08280 [Lachnospiraceae bacterium]|nr:hypothetical protein [Candidatus Fimimorpha excrementavium]